MSVCLTRETRIRSPGYKRVLNAIYNAVLANGCQTVLDIGFGTGTLTQKLYEHGCTVYGQDFFAADD